MTLPTPTVNADGSIDAIVVTSENFAGATLLTLHLPITTITTASSGRYFLVRCGAQRAEERAQNWQFPLRKPIFIVSCRTTTQADGMPVGEWQFFLAGSSENSSLWLQGLLPGNRINLLGPFGNGFQLDSLAQRLLIIADSERAAILFGLIDATLDAGKRVAVLIQGEQLRDLLVARLAIAVEVHYASEGAEWDGKVAELVGWADQLCMVQSRPKLPALDETIIRRRGRFENGFAQVLVEADLVCAVGACLACVVPLANGGLTRACEHGPVMDLRTLI